MRCIHVSGAVLAALAWSASSSVASIQETERSVAGGGITGGKLASTDGVYGIRFAHNMEGTVSGLTMTKR